MIYLTVAGGLVVAPLLALGWLVARDIAKEAGRVAMPDGETMLDYHPPQSRPQRSGRVVSDLDIYRAAALLIRQHGEKAQAVAAQRGNLMATRKDREGQELWQRIRRAIIDLQAEPAGSTVH